MSDNDPANAQRVPRVRVTQDPNTAPCILVDRVYLKQVTSVPKR